MTIGYAAAGELLETWAQARSGHDGDAFTQLFNSDALLAIDPWDAPLAGHNALRAYLLAAALAERNLEVVIERHWVAGDTVLAAWHAGWADIDGSSVREAGFATVEVSGGRIARMRLWTVSGAGRHG